MSAQRPSVNVSGDYAQVTVLYETGARDFFEPRLENFQPPNFPELDKSKQLAELFYEKRLLLVATGPNINSYPLVGHIAWYLSSMRRGTGSAAQQRALAIQEWSGSGGQLLEKAIEQYPEPTIFILPQLQPQHVGHDINRLFQVLGDRHYAIVPVEQATLWEASLDQRSLARYLHDLRSVEVYTAKDLGKFLADRLLEHQKKLPGVIKRDDRKTTLLICGEPLQNISAKLKTPDNIDDFVRLLCDAADLGPVTQETIASCVNMALDDTSRLRQWYYNLDDRAQHIALALHLFDGLPIPQLFEALDELGDKVWKHCTPPLRGLDYSDLEPFDRFHSRVPLSRGGEVMKARLQEQRRALIQVVWPRHRRRILVTIPLLYRYAQESVAASVNNLTLYGNQDRRDQLRKIISETISDIGLMDHTSVEDALLRMAINPNIGIQSMAARAIGRWREAGQRELPLSLLRRWMDSKDVEVTISKIIPADSEKDAEEQSNSPKTFLKETIALAIGYAAQSDQPDKMSPVLVSLLEDLVHDDHEQVRKYLASFTLPMLLPIHLRQIEPIVFDLTQHKDLHSSIANSMRQAYRKQPYDVADALEYWYQACLDPRTSKNASRRKLLQCVCEIYGRIPTDVPGGPLQAEHIIELMRQVLAGGDATEVRHKALETIILHSYDKPGELWNVVRSVTVTEKATIIETLGKIFIEQRERQRGGQDGVNIDSKYFSVWLPPYVRPRTAIEQEMHDWIQDPSHPQAQQIAVEAELMFVRLVGKDEQRRIREVLFDDHRSRLKQTPDENSKPIPRMFGWHTYDWYLYYIVPWLVAFDNRQYRKVIQGVLPEIVEQNEVHPSLVRVLIGEWTYIADNDMRELAKRLPAAISWARRRIWVLIGLTLVLLIILVFVVLIGAAIFSLGR